MTSRPHRHAARLRPPGTRTPDAKQAWGQLAEYLSAIFETCDCIGREVHLHSSPDEELFAAALTHGPACPLVGTNCLDPERSPKDTLLLDTVAFDGRVRQQSDLVQ